LLVRGDVVGAVDVVDVVGAALCAPFVRRSQGSIVAEEGASASDGDDDGLDGGGAGSGAGGAVDLPGIAAGAHRTGKRALRGSRARVLQACWASR